MHLRGLLPVGLQVVAGQRPGVVRAPGQGVDAPGVGVLVPGADPLRRVAEHVVEPGEAALAAGLGAGLVQPLGGAGRDGNAARPDGPCDRAL